MEIKTEISSFIMQFPLFSLMYFVMEPYVLMTIISMTHGGGKGQI